LVFAVTIIAALMFVVSAQSTPASVFSAKVFNQTGYNIAGMTVTGVSEDGQIVSQQTDVDGMVHFELSPGRWRFTTCHQSSIHDSISGSSTSTWLVKCNQVFVPLVIK